MDRKRPRFSVFCGPGLVFGHPGIRADRFGQEVSQNLPVHTGLGGGVALDVRHLLVMLIFLDATPLDVIWWLVLFNPTSTLANIL